MATSPSGCIQRRIGPVSPTGKAVLDRVLKERSTLVGPRHCDREEDHN